MSKKPITPQAEIEADVAVVENTDVAPPIAAVAEELYDATLTKTVKHGGEWHYPGTVFKGIGVDLAAALQSASAADISPAEIA